VRAFCPHKQNFMALVGIASAMGFFRKWDSVPVKAKIAGQKRGCSRVLSHFHLLDLESLVYGDVLRYFLGNHRGK